MSRKKGSTAAASNDRDTMRPEHDFSDGVRRITAARYAEGSNVIVVDPDVLDVFPDAQSVNDALRALADIIRRCRGRRSPETS